MPGMLPLMLVLCTDYMNTSMVARMIQMKYILFVCSSIQPLGAT